MTMAARSVATKSLEITHDQAIDTAPPRCGSCCRIDDRLHHGSGFGSGSGRKRYAAEVFRGYDTAGGKRLP